MTDSEILFSLNYAVDLEGEPASGGDDPTKFARNQFTASTGRPALVTLRRAGLVDASNDFSGNAEDAIWLYGYAGSLVADIRLEPVGAIWTSDSCSAYYLQSITGGTVTVATGAEWYDACGWYVGAGTAGGLALEPNAQMTAAYLLVDPYSVGGSSLSLDEGARMAATGGVSLRYDASLAVTGTATNPVTFTSAQASPAPGDWGGIYLGVGTTASITHATIEYASVGLQLYDDNATITNSTVSDSSVYGVAIGAGVFPYLSGMTYSGNPENVHYY